MVQNLKLYKYEEDILTVLVTGLHDKWHDGRTSVEIYSHLGKGHTVVELEWDPKEGFDKVYYAQKYLRSMGYIAISYYEQDSVKCRRAKPGEETEYPYYRIEDVDSLEKFEHFLKYQDSLNRLTITAPRQGVVIARNASGGTYNFNTKTNQATYESGPW